ncbi:DNA phosphorothioation-associated protein 4 [Clostridium massiliamazoniense]|uniref:DNA phosphorothioation-associated protein 4 n=1 Tax=Clostridium massiliamazoniense TaxID=1347366 RepID=UPI0006D85A4D|nr:DNA phosphorothioation-associated protein 4 [Clostridium massiliamazoniense]
MRALNKSQEFEGLYQDLGNKENKLFNSMKDIYVLAAIIGAKEDKRKPFSNKGGEPIKESIFSDSDRTFMNFIAIDRTKDLSILKDEEDSIEQKAILIEEYANGGMEILKKYLGEDYLSLDNLIEAITNLDRDLEELKPKKDIADILNSIVIE